MRSSCVSALIRAARAAPIGGALRQYTRIACNAIAATHANRRGESSIERKPGFDTRSATGGRAARLRPHRSVAAESAAFAAVGDAACDEISGDFAQQVLRERAGAALGETEQFDQILRGEAHVGLLRCGASRAPPQNMKFSLL
ncbi:MULTISPECIES: hypothetical protein [Burkholderia]|uniref:hypothetical protein n=1 Tax=Burkholderia TaxID=32008 RepID=UPI0018D20AF4|nr:MULTISPECIES: hypothetical protein [Burkholderia]